MESGDIREHSSLDEVPIYNSPDEIPIPKDQQIPRIDFDGLPDYNVIKIFVNYVADIKDSYPEYAWQNALAMLSALTRRRLHAKMNGEFVYMNLWTLSLGISGYARKSGAIEIARRILNCAVENIFLPEDTTPEGLIKAMATKVSISTKATSNKKCVISSENDMGEEIPFSQRALWKDEAGQLYAQMGKSHMQGMGELFCKLHGCGAPYIKELASERIIIRDYYFPMNLATTPVSFLNHATNDDISTGFIARHLIVNPSYSKNRMPIKEDSDSSDQTEHLIIKCIKIIDKVLANQGLRARFPDEQLDIIDKWAEEREEYFAMNNNETMSSFFAKYQTNVMRIATLIELGNIPYYILNNLTSDNIHADILPINKIYPNRKSDNIEDLLDLPDRLDYELCELKISTASIQFALKMMDSIYIPYAANLELNSEKSYFKNDVEKVEQLMKKNRKMDHSSLLKAAKLKACTLTESMHSLLESETITFCQVRTKTKPQLWYSYIPSDKINYNFKLDYSKVNIQRFEPDMKFKLIESSPHTGSNNNDIPASQW